MKKIIIIVLLVILIAPLAKAAPGEGGNIPDQDTEKVSLDNPLGEKTTPQKLIGRVINAILGVVGSLTLLMFVYGGLTLMTAAGNTEKVDKGRKIITWAAVGLIIIFASYSLVDFLINRALGA